MNHRRRLALAVPLLLVALLFSACAAKSSSSAGSASSAAVASNNSAAPGSSSAATSSAGCPTSNTTAFAKTKFVLHTGLAFGAFHRYIYKPYRAGTFRSGAHGRISAFVKAGLAALFIKREVRLAYGDVKANPTLCKTIAAPLQAVGDKISGVVNSLKGGDTSGVSGIQQSVQQAEAKASAAGTKITENANPPLS
jgi:hypothetical protein